MQQTLVRLINFSGRRPWLVLMPALLLAVAGLVVSNLYLSVDTDTDHLFSDQLPWRQHSLAFTKKFPQFSDVLIAVVRAPTPEEAQETAAQLAARLAADTNDIRSVATPGMSPFLGREGLLLLPADQLSAVLQTLTQARPLLGLLAADPTGRGIFNGIGMMLSATQEHMQRAASASAPVNPLSNNPMLDRIAQTLDAAANGATSGNATPLSWQSLLMPAASGGNAGLEFLLIHPVLNHDTLEPGAKARQALLAAAAQLPDVQAGRAQVSYTGSVPLSDEEFSSLSDHAIPIAVGSLLLLTFWLALALRSWRLVVAVFITLAVGLIYTLGFAALAISRLNLISVAFTVLFVGLAVDFGIQFSVRLYAMRRAGQDFTDTLNETAAQVGKQIGLAAIAIACGFLSFAPTHFAGVAELGIIAGAGMLLALLCTLTVLPAVLALLARDVRHAEIALPGGQAADRWLARYRAPVIALFVILALASVWAAVTLPFDANPLHTKRADTPAMRTLDALMDTPTANPFTIQVLAPDLKTAQDLSARLRQLPEVAQIISGAVFVPDAADQEAKLHQIRQAQQLLAPVLHTRNVPAPSAAELRAAAQKLHLRIAGIAPYLPPDASLLRIDAALEKLLQAPDATLLAANAALTRFLPQTYTQLDLALSAMPISLPTLPADFRKDWFTDDGAVRIQVVPTAQAQTTAGLRQFVRAVQGVAPQAAGAAVSITQSADTILQSFRQSAAYALIAIAVVLLLTLRRLSDTALVWMTLLMSALLTALFARCAGIAINFANIIALPLLLGIGVSFNVYFVMNWRNGARQFLGSPTAHAILFSALTTGTAFGSLAISRHPGTASMGLLLLLSLLAVLIATFVFLPAVLYAISQGERQAPRR